MFFFCWWNKVKGNFLGCLILRKKKALTQIYYYYYYSSTPSNLKDSSKGRGGGLLFAFFFALFMETRYFEETDNSYHDFFQHSYKQNLGSFTTTSSVPLEKEIQN